MKYKSIFYLVVIILTIIIFSNSLLHLLLLFGAPFGEYVLGGSHKIIPNNLRFLNFTFFILFSFAGISFLQYGDIIKTFINKKFLFFIIIVFTIFFGYGIIGNLFLTNNIKETYVMTPVCIVSFSLSIVMIIMKKKIKL